MRCSDVEALWDVLREEAEPPEAAVATHLRSCRTCQAMYEEFEGVAYCLTCLSNVEPPPSLFPRVLAHIRSLRSHYRTASADSFARLPSPLGELAIAWRDSGITFVGLARDQGEEELRGQIERRLRRPVHAGEPPAWVRETVRRFFSSWSVDMERVDISDLSPFVQAALRKAAQIPPGQVRSYGWIAREIGRPQAARAVGQAMANNPVALFFPCHRVVDAAGALHNYGYGVEVKARILAMEGYRKS